MLIILFIVALQASNCDQKEINLVDIPGVYVCNHKYAPDTLVVSKDSSYLHIVHLDSRVIMDTGCWKYEDDKMYFQEFKFYIEEYGPTEMIGTWVSRIKTNERNEIKFIMSSEQNEYYEKIYPITPMLKIQ